VTIGSWGAGREASLCLRFAKRVAHHVPARKPRLKMRREKKRVMRGRPGGGSNRPETVRWFLHWNDLDLDEFSPTVVRDVGTAC
jgi:hypothetical protein